MVTSAKRLTRAIAYGIVVVTLCMSTGGYCCDFFEFFRLNHSWKKGLHRINVRSPKPIFPGGGK